MQDTELFLSLAEIAGVFVGFGALIAVRSAGSSEAVEVAYIRSVMIGALWVVVAAFAPVTLSRYGVTGHELWLVSSLVAVASFVGVWVADRLTPEAREAGAAYSRAQIRAQMISNSVLVIPMVAALTLVVLGLVPNQEPALYLTAVVLGLLLAALVLLQLVLSQRRPRTASDPAARPATGGSSA